MSMKKADLEKHLAKKLDGRMKSTSIPKRFAQGSAQAAAESAAKREKPAKEATNKLVSVACRLPADLLNRVRDRAASHEGGINALMAQALERWLENEKPA
ncbi:MAG TPA: hypothetical protein VGM81_00640 [Burkholderiaceae bacterium]|jgi:hypothetical protein